MRNKTHATELLDLLDGARYEILPTASVEDAVHEHLAPGRTVTITASPSRGLEATLALSERLACQGYDIVPHLAARMVNGRTDLAEICARLTAVGIRSIFIPAGDQDPPVGDFASALDLLEALDVLGRPFSHVGVTGYPESHPVISDDVTVQAMWDKRRHATHLVSNLTFDPQLVAKFLRRVRSRGVMMPVFVGLPGPVERAKLLSMAARIGVGESTRFLAKNKRVFAGIATPGGYDPLRFLERCGKVLTDPDMLVAGLHVFTFNQVAETEQWRRTQIDRLGAGIRM